MNTETKSVDEKSKRRILKKYEEPHIKNQFKKSFHEKNPYISYVMIFIMAIFYTFASQMFMTVAGTVPTGVMSIAVVISYIAEEMASYISLMYLVLNIPLLILFWKKSKRKYMYKTTFFLVAQTLVGILFMFPTTRDPIQTAFFYGYKPQMDVEGYRELVWPIIILASIGSLLMGFAIALCWKYGGSTGGTDIVVNYISNVKKKAVGKTSRYFSYAIGAISYIIVISVEEAQRALWLPILISTLLFVIITSMLIDRIYPKYSKVRVDIYSRNNQFIQDKLRETQYEHAWNMFTHKSGVSGEDREMLSTTMYLLELRDFLRRIYEYDEKAWISVMNIRDSYGDFSKTTLEKITE